MADLLEESRARTAMRRSLRRWYDRHGRDLPWRRNRSLYHVWVSE
ncbi:MAG TPA: A/G-specific adenine glycosylase, partial [Planctomycetaceae bacterium]|nr:A/G-specific adenine glycosylase [Planctomycetaceae bacterium]